MKLRFVLGAIVLAGCLGWAGSTLIPTSPALRPDATQPAPPPANPTPLAWQAERIWIAGEGAPGLQDGVAAQARFADPYGVVADAMGKLYVADAGENNRIRVMTADGTVSTLAGSKEGFEDGTGSAAAFNTPSGLALDATGNLYVADTGNHAIRKITPQGVVSTVAGTGQPGLRDGPATAAQFNGPLAVAVGRDGSLYVADTYNDRIRVIQPDGNVTTLAGGPHPGHQDGPGGNALFDMPCALALDHAGNLWIADTRNRAIRKLAPNGEVSTFAQAPEQDRESPLRRPLGLAISRDGSLYVGDASGGRILQLAPTGEQAILIGETDLADSFARPSGLTLDNQGMLVVADAQATRLYRLRPKAAPGQPTTASPVPPAPVIALPNTAGRWPVKPQYDWHEVVGTVGEVRGNFRGERRDHLHSGLDIQADVGAEVLAIADAKVSDPLATWGFGNLSEGLGLDTLSYIHMRVGRTAQNKVLDPTRFLLLSDTTGKPNRMRVRRGTRFKAGEVLGTVNGMAHVHMGLTLGGIQRNAIELGFRGFTDQIAPTIDRIQLAGTDGQTFTRGADGRIQIPHGVNGVQIVVDAWDKVDRNLPRRRLGLHSLGFQILRRDGTPAPGFEHPRMNIDFGSLPLDDQAVKTAYADNSGITVHGSTATRFLYVATHLVRDGRAEIGSWQPATLPAGDYTLRIIAMDYAGNMTTQGNEIPVTLL
ncbi:gluconolaconase [Chitinivorax sp. B]|uniref:NHL domain-containing protein n=1 Tax=Chitinivorax sp. B TaxID=2502235 RepID=UPI0010F59936|nr:gluconolaconase [Chitinivorax sp. B]